MAETRSKKNGDRKNGKRQKVDRKSQILSVLMMLFSTLLVIGILTYSRSDEQFTDISLLDLFKLPFDDILKEKASHVTNALSLVGALIANLLINGTIGYAVIILPVLLMMWGWIILRKNDPTNALKLTNYAIVIAILFSATMGVTGQIFGTVEKEWSGLVGAFMGDVLTKLIGKAGAALIVLTSLLIILVLAVDLDIYKTLNRIKQGFDRVAGWFVSKKNGQRVVDLDVEDEDAADAETEFTIKKFDEDTTQKDEKPVKPKPPKQIIFNAPEDEAEEEEIKTPALTNKIEEPEEEEKSETMAPEFQEEEEIDYVFPSVELLDSPRQADVVNDEELRANAELLKSKLANFGIELESVSVTPGPVITLYELVPASGVKISRIVSLENDLALALAAKGIRIIAPIPGKGTIGVEIPNHNPSIVNIRSVLNSTKYREAKAALPLAMGKTISGEVFVDDLAKMPHLLIAGATGSGKSIGINSIIISLLYKLHPSEVKFVIIDPKKIELTLYKRLVNHYLATSSDFRDEIITTPENSVSILKSVEVEMEKRYNRFANAGARNIAEYNDKVKTGKIKSTPEFKHLKMPYIIVIIDELADLMITAAKEIEEPITRLAQMARAVGIHLVVATQRPSVDVITGVIKANFPARIAYQVASKTDSRTILDMNGAEALLGSGDMLYLPSGSPKPMRIQNVYVSTDEVEAIMNHIAKQKGYTRLFKLPSVLEKRKNGYSGRADERDELFNEAAYLVVRHQQASVSLIQRRQKVGYSRAARIVDELEAAGIVGPYDGSKARQVLVETEETLREILRNTE
ncbi:MAG: DNA translocase FtsK 4TM domain-containing protein [Bacteroidota bacterium]|nr:DNA translocase FtsK 4TM domain-containing protein [Bacteroidota bacterium]